MIGGSRSSHGEHHEHGEHDERLGLQHSGTVTLKLKLDASPALERLVRELLTRSDKQQEQIMANIQDVMDATERNGAAARAAAVRVNTDLTALRQQVTDLQAAVTAGGDATAKLAAMESGLGDVVTAIDAITLEEGNIDPAPPPPPADPNAPPV